MTLSAAIHYLKGSEYDRDVFREAQQTAINAGLCPNCAVDGHRVKLMPFEPGNHAVNAGRECPVCDMFWTCGEQPEYEPDPWNGDADKGL